MQSKSWGVSRIIIPALVNRGTAHALLAELNNCSGNKITKRVTAVHEAKFFQDGLERDTHRLAMVGMKRLPLEQTVDWHRPLPMGKI